MDKEIAISELVKMDFDEAFNKGNCYGFFDWFCKDTSGSVRQVEGRCAFGQV